MESISIRKVLDLALHLVDATTGRTVDENLCKFYRNGEVFLPAPRGDGIFVLVNTGREDFELTIQVKGFEKMTLPIRYEELDEKVPLKDIYLIPLPQPHLREGFVTVDGYDPSITSIEAIRLDRPCVLVSNYNERRLRITLTPTESKYNFSEKVYALLEPEGESYQYLYPGDEIEKFSYHIKKPLEKEFHENSTLFRIIYGIVQDGHYLLRVRDDGAILPYLIRYVKDGAEYFTHPDLDAVRNGERLIL